MSKEAEKRPTILIVEDDGIVRLNLIELLSAEGFSVLEASGLTTALNLIFSARRIDLIVSDLSLGKEKNEGFLILDRIKREEETRDIPVILLTAYAEKEIIIEAIRLGAAEYLTKPYSQAELLGAIAKHLGKVKREPLTETVSKIEHYIILHSPFHNGEKIVLERHHLIGRHPDCTTSISHSHLSRFTVTLQRMTKSQPVYTMLVDGKVTGKSTNIPSANGVQLNGKKVKGFAPLKNGDKVHLGAEIWFEYHLNLPPLEEDGKATVT